uniref:Uncharacterized protein n=1 Tax=Arundo donax TaxID=35708 RepID=A0A0A9DRW4_ARUDO
MQMTNLKQIPNRTSVSTFPLFLCSLTELLPSVFSSTARSKSSSEAWNTLLIRMHKCIHKFLLGHVGKIIEANLSIQQPLSLKKIHQAMPRQQLTLNAILHQHWPSCNIRYVQPNVPHQELQTFPNPFLS